MHFRTTLVIAAISVISVMSAGLLGLEDQAELRTERGVHAVRSSAWVSRPSAPQSSDTANLYRVHCQMCHGPNGKALIPEMAFVGRKWKHGTKSADMAKIITEGVKGTPMLPFKSKLTAVQIRALARYVRAFDKTLPPEK